MDDAVFEVTAENFSDCIEIYKQILWMYYDMITSYKGFGHNIDFETIDYKKYILSRITEKGLESSDFQHVVKIVREGSLVALCCEVVNLLDEERQDKDLLYFIENLIKQPMMQGDSLEKELLTAISKALVEQGKDSSNVYWSTLPYGSLFEQKLEEVYDAFVLEYYRSMLETGTK